MAASLCGGIGSGPVASGTGTGVTIVVTLTRDVTCDSILYLVWGAGTFGVADFPANPLSCVDSFGHTWTISTSTKALIGQTGDGISSPFKELEVGTALCTCGAGDMSIGDTITLTFDASGLFHPTLLETNVMAFALTGVLDTATSGWKFPPSPTDHPGTDYGEGLAGPVHSGTPTSITYASEGFQPQPDPDCAAISAILGSPVLGTVTPAEGTKVGTNTSTNMTLAVFLFPFIVGGTPFEPGGSWVNASNCYVINYQGIDLAPVVVPTGPTLHGKFRVS